MNAWYYSLFPRAAFTTGPKMKADEIEDSVVLPILKSSPLEQTTNKIIIVQDFINQHVAELKRRKKKNENCEFSKNLTNLQNRIKVDFSKWNYTRLEMIKLFYEYSNNIVTNTKRFSYFRIVVCTADIILNFLRLANFFTSEIDFFLKVLPIFNLLSALHEKELSKQMESDLKEAVKREKESFQCMEKWFKFSDRDDDNIKEVFPYPLNGAVMKRIQECYMDLDDSDKIFLCIIRSNCVDNVNLLRDRAFLSKAELFSKSADATRWFKRYLQRNIILKWNCYNPQNLLKLDLGSYELFLDLSKIFLYHTSVRMACNILAIISDGSNLMYNNISSLRVRHSYILSAAKSAKKEHEEIKKLFSQLLPKFK